MFYMLSPFYSMLYHYNSIWPQYFHQHPTHERPQQVSLCVIDPVLQPHKTNGKITLFYNVMTMF
jgi:hypothetical protein